MADIKQIIDDNIYQNGQQRITGIVMNSVLKAMVDDTDEKVDDLDSELTDLDEQVNGSVNQKTITQEINLLTPEHSSRSDQILLDRKKGDVITISTRKGTAEFSNTNIAIYFFKDGAVVGNVSITRFKDYTLFLEWDIDAIGLYTSSITSYGTIYFLVTYDLQSARVDKTLSLSLGEHSSIYHKLVVYKRERDVLTIGIEKGTASISGSISINFFLNGQVVQRCPFSTFGTQTIRLESDVDSVGLYIGNTTTAGTITFFCSFINEYIGGLRLTKQDALVSGENIKTINGNSILGGGNLEIQGGTSDIDTELNPLTATNTKAAGAKVTADKLFNLSSMMIDSEIERSAVNKYIYDDYNVGSVVDLTPRNTSSAYKYAILDVTPNDIVIVNGTGGVSARLWCFLDADNKIVSVSGTAITANGLALVVPSEAKKIVINDSSNKISYYRKQNSIVEKIQTLGVLTYQDIEKYKSEDGTFKTSFDISLRGKTPNPYILTIEAMYSGTRPYIHYDYGTWIMQWNHYIKGNGSYERTEIRIPPCTNVDAITLHLTIPSATQLYIKGFSIRQDVSKISWNGGFRFDSHLGYQTMAPENTIPAYEYAAMMGYPACIVNPISSSDGILMCYHENDAFLTTDGGQTRISLSASQFRSKTYQELMAYDVAKSATTKDTMPNLKIPKLEDFFKICARTGMRPMFSTHPAPSDNDWQKIKDMLVKYGLIKQITIKAFDLPVLQKAYSYLGEIDAYIWDVNGGDAQTNCNSLKNSTLGTASCRLGIEYPKSAISESVVNTILSNGLFASVWDVYSTSSTTYEQWQSWGVTEVTDDYFPNSGLNW